MLHDDQIVPHEIWSEFMTYNDSNLFVIFTQRDIKCVFDN